MTDHARPHAIGGPLLPRGVWPLVALALLAGALIVWRFVAGLGATTALNDGYPWGLWIAFDVVTGTAFACGGYALALLVYIMKRGQYHPLVRPALVTGAFGYSIAGFSVLIDVGRPWLAYKLPFFWHWNLRSVLLEVALCIMSYTIVLWLELSPAFLERARTSTIPINRRLGRRSPNCSPSTSSCSPSGPE
jgi:Ni/Fe-hydrogenase subunit HybB-like protein